MNFPDPRWPGAILGLLAGQFLVLDAVGLIGLITQAAAPVSLIPGIVALEPYDIALTLVGEDMGGNAIEKPAVVRDNDGTAGKVEQRFFKHKKLTRT